MCTQSVHNMYICVLEYLQCMHAIHTCSYTHKCTHSPYMIHCARFCNIMYSLQRLTVGLPLYLVWPTKEWKHLKQTIKHLHELCLKHVEEKLQKIREENHGRALEGSEAPYKADFLTYILYSGKQSREEAATNAFDLMSAGIDQVSYIVRLFVRILIALQLSNTGFLPCRQPTPLPGVCTSWEGTQRSRRSCGVRFRGL